MTDSKPKQIPPYGIRIPFDLKERIQFVANSEGRSLHGEIIHALERRYPPVQDTMHLVIDDIRRALVEYEEEDDPVRRLYLQILVEGLAAGSTTVDWEEDK